MGQRLEAYVDAYLVHIRTRVEKPVERRSMVQYRSKIRQFLTWLDGRDITPLVLVEYREHLQCESLGRHGGPGQQPRTIKGAFLPLSGFFDWLWEEHQLELPDPRRVRLPKINPDDHGDYHILTDEEVDRVYELAGNLPEYTVTEKFVKARARVALALAGECAFRRCEIIPLDMSDVVRTAEPWVVRIRRGKGKNLRRNPVNDRLRQLLEDYFTAHAAWCEEEPARKKNPALLPVDRSRRMDADSLLVLRHRALHAAGLPRNTRLHDFRRYRITRWGGVQGVNIKTVQELAGHNDAVTTIGYLDTSREQQLRAVAESPGGAKSPSTPKPRPRLPRSGFRAAPRQRYRAGS